MNFSRLFCEFKSSKTAVRHSYECRANFYVSRIFKKKYANLCDKIFANPSQSHANLSRDILASVANLSQFCRGKIVPKLQCNKFATLARMSYDYRATVLRNNANNSRLSGAEIIKLSDICAAVVRHSLEIHSHECLTTVVRVKMILRDHREALSQMSHDCRKSVSGLWHDSHETYYAKLGKIREIVI